MKKYIIGYYVTRTHDISFSFVMASHWSFFVAKPKSDLSHNRFFRHTKTARVSEISFQQRIRGGWICKETLELTVVEFKCRVSNRFRRPMDVLLGDGFEEALMVSGEMRCEVAGEMNLYSGIGFANEVVSS